MKLTSPMIKALRAQYVHEKLNDPTVEIMRPRVNAHTALALQSRGLAIPDSRWQGGYQFHGNIRHWNPFKSTRWTMTLTDEGRAEMERIIDSIGY